MYRLKKESIKNDAKKQTENEKMIVDENGNRDVDFENFMLLLVGGIPAILILTFVIGGALTFSTFDLFQKVIYVIVVIISVFSSYRLYKWIEKERQGFDIHSRYKTKEGRINSDIDLYLFYLGKTGMKKRLKTAKEMKAWSLKKSRLLVGEEAKEYEKDSHEWHEQICLLNKLLKAKNNDEMQKIIIKEHVQKTDE